MRTLAELSSYVQDIFNDKSTKIQATIQTLTNMVVKKVKRELNIPYSIATAPITTITGQRAYPLPMSYKQLVSLKVNVSSVDYFPKLIASRDQWDILTSSGNTESQSDIPTAAFIDPVGTSSGYKIELFPLPSSANTMTVEFYCLPKDYISADFTDKTAGNVTIANGAAAVVGATTAFAATDVGRYIRFDTDGFWYKILTVTDATHATIDRNFEGLAVTGGDYKIGTVLNIPVDAMEVVGDFLMERLWEKREDFSIAGGKASYYGDRGKKRMKLLVRDFEELYDSPQVHSIGNDTGVNPNDFPTNLS